MPFTASTEALIPLGGKNKMPTRLFFKGEDRKRLKELLRRIEIVERRDGKVGPRADGSSSLTVAVFNAPSVNPNLPGALTQIKNRINQLLAQRV